MACDDIAVQYNMSARHCLSTSNAELGFNVTHNETSRFRHLASTNTEQMKMDMRCKYSSRGHTSHFAELCAPLETTKLPALSVAVGRRFYYSSGSVGRLCVPISFVRPTTPFRSFR
jgi:hypothetical protein